MKKYLPPSFTFMALLFSVPVTQATTYEFQAGQSWVVIHVYKGGALKSLGHNHIISTRNVTGTVSWDKAKLQDTRFQLIIPVESFRVDDPGLRQQAGKKFAKEVSDGARKGTLKNMLGKKVLDGLHFPQIIVQSKAIRQEDATRFIVTMNLKIHGISRNVSVPVLLERKVGVINIKGDFTLLQSNYGIKPLSAAFGTIVVNDRINIYFRLVAKIRRRISSVYPKTGQEIVANLETRATG